MTIITTAAVSLCLTVCVTAVFLRSVSNEKRRVRLVARRRPVAKR